MATTKAGQKAVNKYIAKAYDRINLTIPKGKKEQLQIVAENQGKSLNGYIKEAVADKYKSDTGENIEL